MDRVDAIKARLAVLDAEIALRQGEAHALRAEWLALCEARNAAAAAPLPNTPEMQARVRDAALDHFGFMPSDVTYELGKWWVAFYPPTAPDELGSYESMFGEYSQEATYATYAAPERASGFKFERI